MENSKSGGNGTKNLIDSTGKVNTPDFVQASKQYQKPPSYK